jgi:putative nucleotidyltransferase with HDIG domain
MTQPLTEKQKRTFESLEYRLEHIALLPAVVARLAALDLDSPDATDDVLALVRSDPPLALRLLQLANAQRGHNDIDTIAGAVHKVGALGIAKMILAVSVVEVFVPHTRGQRNLWIHSIQTALAARRLAVLRPDMGLRAEQCFLAGLLHDIGRFLIFEHWPQEMAALDEIEVTCPQELVAAERLVCGFDHAALGYEVCRRWRLPESLCQMAKTHHFYGEARKWVPPEVAVLVRFVQEADCLSFGLLRNPVASFQSDADRTRSIETSLRILTAAERILPAAELTEQLIDLDQEARKAAAGIGVAYS